MSFSLPLEYAKLAEYYDALSQGNDEAKNPVIEGILRNHQAQAVLDFSCGTGAQALYLAKLGYQVTGVDPSKPLLDIAKRKALQERLDIALIQGDMRTASVGKYDAIITIFNVIGHLTTTDFSVALKNIHKNLKSGGLYVFDIINLDAMTEDAIQGLLSNLSQTVGNTHLRKQQYSTLDREKGQLTSHDQFTVQKEAQPAEIYEANFTLQIYTARQLRDLLAKNGFETVNQFGIDGFPFSEQTTENILTVARTISSFEKA